MSHKGSRHRLGDYHTYTDNKEQIHENSKNLTGKPCEKHAEFSKYCIHCWAVTEKEDVDEK